ncbi:MAG: bifunctional DNA-formamidopyrimidine glycosylase/DNA-(apurinic or apyrimidinic site) lyase [Planctomycetes bacterium]|nr:bifunctional DNA-formamidopyrimidine glycosylase/DNA-(apurinic or apyrimidinic site) lyase [Planctomycetota bacterium]
MPELPEVQTVRATLLPIILDARVESVDIHRPDIITGDSSPAALLVGQTITDTARRGKQLALIGSGGSVLIVQLGMTGHFYIPSSSTDLALPHVHIVWTLRTTNRKSVSLLFRDPRRFGELTTLANPAALDARWSSLGPDGLEITGDHLHSTLRHSARPIKAALLDQAVVAGVGNIYADEALFASHIRPGRRCTRIRPAEYHTLADAIRTILAQAISRHGSSIRDYRDGSGQPGTNQNHLLVYGRGGLPCLSCSTMLKSRPIAQRTTVWCPSCQS